MIPTRCHVRSYRKNATGLGLLVAMLTMLMSSIPSRVSGQSLPFLGQTITMRPPYAPGGYLQELALRTEEESTSVLIIASQLGVTEDNWSGEVDLGLASTIGRSYPVPVTLIGFGGWGKAPAEGQSFDYFGAYSDARVVSLRRLGVTVFGSHSRQTAGSTTVLGARVDLPVTARFALGGVGAWSEADSESGPSLAQWNYEANMTAVAHLLGGTLAIRPRYFFASNSAADDFKQIDLRMDLPLRVKEKGVALTLIAGEHSFFVLGAEFDLGM